MRTKNYDWLDTSNGKVLYGIQINLGGGKWMNAAENGKPLLFNTENERDIKRSEIRKRPSVSGVMPN